MKKYFSILMLSAAIIGLTSCESEDSKGLTSITYYPVLSLVGGDVILPVGTAYTEQGCVATLNGVDVSDKVSVSGSVDSDQMGIYTITYSAVNEDGFSASISRNVFVTNPGHIDNLYYGSTVFGTRAYNEIPVIIEDNGDGTYFIDDVLAGFYWGGRYPGYEPTYDFHAEANITVDASGVSVLEVGDWYFGSNVIEIGTSSYDPATGVITYDMQGDFDGFSVVLTPIE